MSLPKYEPLDIVVERYVANIRQIFGGNKHEWRRNGERANRNRRPISIYKRSTRSNRQLVVELQKSYEPLPNLRFLGTNMILTEFGMTNEDITAAVFRCGKDVVQDASRIAGLYAQRGYIDIDPKYLINAVYVFGYTAVRDILLKKGIRPEQLLTEFEEHKIGKLIVLIPTEAKVPLEVITSSSDITHTLKTRELSLIYQRRGIMVFGYNHNR